MVSTDLKMAYIRFLFRNTANYNTTVQFHNIVYPKQGHWFYNLTFQKKIWLYNLYAVVIEMRSHSEGPDP